jgi:hypothetical protein
MIMSTHSPALVIVVKFGFVAYSKRLLVDCNSIHVDGSGTDEIDAGPLIGRIHFDDFLLTLGRLADIERNWRELAEVISEIALYSKRLSRGATTQISYYWPIGAAVGHAYPFAAKLKLP